jgi:hypothetical protein
MKAPLKCIALLLCAFCGVSLAAEKPAKQGTSASKSYAYKTSAGKERKMEIFFPPNHTPSKAKVPGMILFHGAEQLLSPVRWLDPANPLGGFRVCPEKGEPAAFGVGEEHVSQLMARRVFHPGLAGI